MEKIRNSNIELLRIIIMFLILVLHANFKAFDVPNDCSVISLGRSFLESICIVSVNIFVIITGYFGTSFKIKKIGALVFQCFFAVVPISIAIYFTHIYGYESTKELILSFNFLGYWFILAYVALLSLTPFLEDSIKSFTSEELLKSIVIAYIIIGLLCVIPQFDKFGVDGGYSAIWFIILYLIGGYIRKTSINLSIKKLVAILFLALSIESLLLLKFGFVGGTYNNPLILVSSICVFLLFLKLDFSNKFINYIAASTTMVYLINEHPVVSVLYHNYLNELFEKSGTLVSFLVQSSILIIVSFGASIIYDRLRMNIYKGIQRLFNGCL